MPFHTTTFDAIGVTNTVTVTDRAALAAAETVRRWTAGRVELQHIVDPATGATAAIVLGDRAAAWLTARGFPARLVRPSGAVLVVGDWPLPLEAELAGSAS